MQRIRLTLLVILVLLVASTSALGQLTGTKTIGGTTPDYATIKAAIQDINTMGVGAPGVTFLIRDGVYTEDSLLIRTSTSGPSAPIVFKPDVGANVVINVTPPATTYDFAIKIDTTQSVTFDGSNNGTTSRNMTINALGTNGRRGFWVSGASHYTTIKNCMLNVGETATLSTSVIGIDFRYTGATQDPDFILAENNLIRYPYTGIRLEGWTTGDVCESPVIRNNVIDSVANAGIYTLYHNDALIYNNDVNVMRGSSATMYGIYAGSVVQRSRIYSNRVHDMNQLSTTSTMYGIYLSTSSTLGMGSVFNNFIWNLNMPATGTGLLYGIYVSTSNSTIPDTIAFNTVSLTGSSTGNRATRAFGKGSATGAVYLYNNILHNTRTDGTTGIAAAIYKNATTTVVASNNNNLYVGTPDAQHVTGVIVSTTHSTLADWRTANGSDAQSFTENSPFVSATDLHIQTAVPTQLESGGSVIAAITTDIDGNTRNASTPDVGADEFAGTGLDLTPPVISHTPLMPSPSTANRVASATMTDASGFPAGTGAPRLWYKRSTDPSYTAVTADSVVGDEFYFSIPGQSAGTTVQYYLAAQDASSSNNLSTLPAGGSGINPPGSTPPSSVYSYFVQTPIPGGSYTIGAGGTYPTLQAAFDSLMLNGVGGPITLNLTDTVYVAPGKAVPTVNPSALPSLGTSGAEMAYPSVYGELSNLRLETTGDSPDTVGQLLLQGPIIGMSSTNTITIRPATNTNVRLIGNGASLFAFVDASHVIIDGISLAGDGAQSLSMEATVGAGVAYFGNSDNNVLRNVTLRTPANSAIYLDTLNGAAPSNNLFENNRIPLAFNGVYARGGNYLAVGNQFVGNEFGSATDSIGQAAIYNQQVSGSIIADNVIQNVHASGTANAAGVWIATRHFGTQIYNNAIFNIRINPTTSATFAAGLYIFGTSGDNTSGNYYNNMIYDLDNVSTSVSSVIRALYASTGVNDTIVYNSVYVTGEDNVARVTAALQTSTHADQVIRNNNLVNTRLATGTGRAMAFHKLSTTSTLTSNYNNLYVPTQAGSYVGGVGSTNYTTLADWRSVGYDSNGVSVVSNFVPPHLHINTVIPTLLNGGATPIPGKLVDFDGDPRDLSTPDIGADEFSVTPVSPPSVTGVSRSTRVPAAGDTTVVTCTIRDTLGITSANLIYNVNGTPSQVAMVRTSGTDTNGTYRGVIPGAANADGNRVEYQIQANSLSGSNTTTPIIAANSYYAGISPLSLSGLRRVTAGGKLIDSLYYARVTGTVNGPNFQTTNLGYHFQDAVGGIQLFSFGMLIPPLNLGDSIIVTGRLAQFRGLTEIIPDTQTVDIQVVATGRTVTPVTVPLPTFKANPEMYESMLIKVQGLNRRDATPPWPAAGGSANIVMYQGVVTDTIIMRIDSDTEIDGSPEPAWPRDVAGVVSQFSSATSVYNNGYQTQPRYLTDFTDPTGPLLFEQFESGVFPPAGWSTYIVAGDSGWRSATTAPLSGTTHAFNRYNPAGTLGSKFLVTRRIDVPTDAGAGTYELSFWARRAFATPFPPDTVYVKISTTDSLPASFTQTIYKCYTGNIADTATDPNIYTTNYRRFKTNITGITGTLFIAFDHQDNDGQTIYLEDVKLEALSVHDIGVANVSDLPADQPGSLEPPATSRNQQAERAAKASIELAPTANKNGSDASFEKPLIHFVTRETNGTVTLEARVANYGSFVENSYQVGWTIDGVAQPNVNNTQPLEIGDVDTVSLSWASPTPGTHTARAWTILAGDVNAANDTSAPFVFEVLPDNIIYEETFADTTIPAGWLVVNNDGSPGTTTTWQYRSIVSFTGGGTVLPQAGNRFWFASYTGANGFLIDEWLISPQIPAANFDTLYFYAGAVGGSFPDSLKVKVSTTGNNVADFVHELGYFRIPGPIGAWHRFAVPLTQFRGQNIYFAINYYIVNGGPSGTNSDNVWADHPFITGAPIGFFDDFEAYTVGQQLVVQNPTDWSTWSGPAGTAEDPFISSAQAFSGTKSVVIVTNNDLVKRLGNDTTGTHEISFKFYVPSGKAGYFNTLATFTPPSTFNWGMEAYFDSTGNGRLFAGSATAVPFTYTRNAWQTATVVVNLTIDSARFVMNGNVIRTWRWTAGASGGTSPKRLAANDFYGATAWDQMFMDDYRYRPGTWTGVDEQPEQLPETFVLMQNYPNPFNPTTTIQYALPAAATVSLRIYNLLGQEVATLVDESQSAGYHTAIWNGRNQYGAQVATGVYFYRIEARSTDGAAPFTALKKMLLVK